MIGDAYLGKFHMIITKEVSRFSRNILDTIAYTRELRAIGVGVIFANDRINTLEPESEMLLSFFASLAQEESRRTSSRVIWGQTRQMERGIVFGTSMLGYDVKNGSMTINETGAEIVRLIFHKYAVEQVSTSEIARYLICKGYYTYTGGRNWRSNTIIKILNNEKYVGDLVQKKTYTPDFLTHKKKPNHGEVPVITIKDHHEPIISRKTWNLAQERLKNNNKHIPETISHSNRYIFSGKIKCGECGHSFVGRFKYLKDGTKIRRWSCSTTSKYESKACNVGKLVRDDDAMQMLKTSIRNLPIDFNAISKYITELALNAVETCDCSLDCNSQRLQNEIEQIQKKKESLLDSYFSGEIKKEDMQIMNLRYEEKIAHLRLQKMDYELWEQETWSSNALQLTIQSRIIDILNGNIESDAFYKNMLNSLTVFKDRHMELRLNFLPQVFRFAE